MERAALVTLLASGALAAGIIGACSGDSNATGVTATTKDGGGGAPSTDAGDAGSSVTSSPGSCSNPTVALAFSPMYSAFIPGSSAQTFQVPVVLRDGSAATWSASDPSQAKLSLGLSGGALVTVNGVGTGTSKQVTIFATKADGSCGASVLQITTNTENDWKTGQARYNNGVALSLMPPAGFDGGPPMGPPDGGLRDGGFMTSDGGSFFERDGGTACTNCHGPTASSLFKDVAHTPEQTAGFSDSELIDIVVNGKVPDGGYFDPNVIIADASGDPSGATQARAYQQWHALHQWNDITADEQPGMVVYLRSLTPAAQTGSSNFGGLPAFDGGAFGPPPGH